MILGMTGTRNKLTYDQFVWLNIMVAEECDELHHGACVNADEDAHDAAIQADKVIVVHPPTDERLMMPRWKFSQRACIYVMQAKPYNVRNLDIVRASDRMIALPDGPYRKGSGTWNTIGFAEQAKKRVTICYPDGSLDDRVPSLGIDEGDRMGHDKVWDTFTEKWWCTCEQWTSDSVETFEQHAAPG